MQLAAKAFGFFRSNYTISSVFARAQYEILLADKIPFIFSIFISAGLQLKNSFSTANSNLMVDHDCSFTIATVLT